MKSKRFTRNLLPYALLAILIVGPVWLMWRQIRQEQLDQALVVAIEHNNPGTVARLLASGATVTAHKYGDTGSSFWVTFLHRLLGQNIAPKPAVPALLLAIERRCDPAIIQELLDRGADPNVKDAEGRTALWVDTDFEYVGVNNHEPEVMALLLRHGADVNRPAPGSEGRTLLMNAAGWGSDHDIDIWIPAGAHIDALSKDGSTALWYAVDNARVENVKALIRWHADVNIKRSDGKTPLAFARANLRSHITTSFNHEAEEESWRAVVKSLQQAGAKP